MIVLLNKHKIFSVVFFFFFLHLRLLLVRFLAFLFAAAAHGEERRNNKTIINRRSEREMRRGEWVSAFPLCQSASAEWQDNGIQGEALARSTFTAQPSLHSQQWRPAVIVPSSIPKICNCVTTITSVCASRSKSLPIYTSSERFDRLSMCIELYTLKYTNSLSNTFLRLHLQLLWL